MHPVERQRSELYIPSTGITLLEGQDTLDKTGVTRPALDERSSFETCCALD